MNNIEKIIYDETKKRLEIMADNNYKFPNSFTKIDWSIIIFLIIINIIFIMLCMIGVIL